MLLHRENQSDLRVWAKFYSLVSAAADRLLPFPSVVLRPFCVASQTISVTSRRRLRHGGGWLQCNHLPSSHTVSPAPASRCQSHSTTWGHHCCYCYCCCCAGKGHSYRRPDSQPDCSVGRRLLKCRLRAPHAARRPQSSNRSKRPLDSCTKAGPSKRLQ